MVSQTLHTEEKHPIGSVVFQKLSEAYTTKSTWVCTVFIDVTPYAKFMNEVLEDIHFQRGDLQRVHTRYVEVVDPYIPDIIEGKILLG